MRRERVGIRELRQNLSVHLKKVIAGRTLEVTERGRSVAVLAPLPRPTALDRLIASGRVSAAKGRLEDLPPPLKIKLERPLSEIVGAQREDIIDRP